MPRTGRRRLALLGTVVGLGVVVLVVAVLASRSGSGGPSTSPEAAAPAAAGPRGATESAELLRGIPQEGTVLGDPEAPVTLTEYADLQCPACQAYALTAFPTVVSDYVKRGKVKLDFKLLPFIGDDSIRLGRSALIAADAGHLWSFVDLAYRNQGPENSGYATRDFIAGLAGAVPGLNATKVAAGADDESLNPALAKVQAQAISAGVDSTPSFFIGRAGRSPESFEPGSFAPAAFKQALDDALR